MFFYTTGNLEEEEKVLQWLEHQDSNDEIEDVTDEMLDMLIDKMPHVAALFCKFTNYQILNYSQAHYVNIHNIWPHRFNDIECLVTLHTTFSVLICFILLGIQTTSNLSSHQHKWKGEIGTLGI